MVPFRLVFALLLFIMSVIIVAAHNGQLWGGELWLLLTVPGMLVHLWIVYRIRPSTTHRSRDSRRPASPGAPNPDR